MATTDEFHALVESHRDRVYRFCFYYLRGGEDAEDVTQEVFIRLWNNLGNVSPDKIPAWLNRVTRNACVDVVRRKISYRNVIAEGNGTGNHASTLADRRQDPAAQVESADVIRELQTAMRRLDEPYRSVLIFREIEELSYSEIAETLDMPLNTVKVYLHRGRRMLRERLRESVIHGDL